MIKLENISKSYRQNKALDRVNLDIREGHTTVLIGPSGCGKSTLIRIIIGLIQPDAGNVYLENQRLSDQNVRFIRRKIGYVIQEGGLFPHLKAGKNVSLMAGYLGWKKKLIEERIRQLAELTKFPLEGLGRYPVQLSGGQRQRVSLMRALMLDPDILLLDEPLAALDPMIRYQLQNDLKNIFRQLGKTVLLVTHDLGEAGFFGHTIVLMKKGAIVQQGAFRDLLESPATRFVTEFVQAQRSVPELSGSKEI